jgi:regulator of sigma E protease
MIGILQTLLGTLIPFLLVLTLVVTVHELGHFLAAKSCGVAIDRFSIGFGKALASWKDRSGVEWRIGWIPFGGYVRFAGDENAASVPDHEDLDSMRRDIVKREGVEALNRYYHFKPVWQRAFIAAAGPISNFILAIAIFAGFLLAFGQYVLPPRIAAVTPASPAFRAGFQAQDLIVQADGRPISSFDDLAQLAQLRVNLPTQFVVERSGHPVAITATSEWQLRDDGFGHKRRQGTFGLQPVQAPSDFIHRTYNPVEALQGGVDRTWKVLSSTIYYLGRMVTGQVSADQLSGPLGIARMSGDVARVSTHDAPDLGAAILHGGVGLLQFAALISVSIGFLNLLPIPVLDGGHLLFYAYEALARRPLAARVQAAGYRLGLALVLGLLLFGTWNDLQQLSVLKILGGS